MSIQKVDKQTGNTSLICGSTLFAEAPLATIFPLMSNNIPTGFLLCDGTAYRKADYPELWEILPSTVKDTTNNTFTIDLRESSLKGVGLTSKSNNHYDSDGVALGEFIDDRIQDHRHSLPLGTASGGDAVMLAQNTLIDNTGTVENDYRKGATTEVKAVGVNYIIKAKMVALPSDLEAQVDEKLANPTVERLFAGLVTTSLADYTLSKDITQYRELLFVTQGGSGVDVGNASEFVDTIPVKAFIELCTNISNFMLMLTRQGASSSTWWIRAKYKDSTHISMYAGANWTSDYVYIYGIR